MEDRTTWEIIERLGLPTAMCGVLLFIVVRYLKEIGETLKEQTTILAVLALAGMTAVTQAGILLSDTFSYPDGLIVGAAGSPWFSMRAENPDTMAGAGPMVAGST